MSAFSRHSPNKSASRLDMRSSQRLPTMMARVERALKKLYGQYLLSRASRIVLGGVPQELSGWSVTNRDVLDVTVREDFARYWEPGTRKAFFAEHVWEHLEEWQAIRANANCFEFLKPGGRLRLAVPDGLHPEALYIENVRPGGTGAGAEDHKVLYTYRTLLAGLSRVGFDVELLEYWDEAGSFHCRQWSDHGGRVNRSSRFDRRNVISPLSYTSLIVDAVKPA